MDRIPVLICLLSNLEIFTTNIEIQCYEFFSVCIGKKIFCCNSNDFPDRQRSENIRFYFSPTPYLEFYEKAPKLLIFENLRLSTYNTINQSAFILNTFAHTCCFCHEQEWIEIQFPFKMSKIETNECPTKHNHSRY